MRIGYAQCTRFFFCKNTFYKNHEAQILENWNILRTILRLKSCHSMLKSYFKLLTVSILKPCTDKNKKGMSKVLIAKLSLSQF